MIRAGIIREVIAAKGAVRVNLPDADNTDTYELPVLHRNSKSSRHYHLPEVGDQVYVALDDNGEDGCVLGAIYSDADAPPFSSANQCGMVFSDSTTVKYDKNAHLMDIEFLDGTVLQYDAQSHSLSVSACGTVNVNVQGNAAVTSDKVISISAAQGIALTSPHNITLNSPQIALNTAALTCLDPDSLTGYCAATFKGNVNVESQSYNVDAAAITLKAPVAIQGSVTATGSITAEGSIIDSGSNTNHHTHPQYMLK